jgi:hypothetical protein
MEILYFWLKSLLSLQKLPPSAASVRVKGESCSIYLIRVPKQKIPHFGGFKGLSA